MEIQLTKEEQEIAVKKVLDEMTCAENFLRGWKISWTENLVGASSIDFNIINWDGIKSKNSRRSITFWNDGDISLEKTGRKISYNAEYNVLSNNFSIDIRKRDEEFSFKVELENQKIIINYNDFEIVCDLSNGNTIINYKTIFNSSIVSMKKVISSDLRFFLSRLQIETLKSHNKVNGIYRFDIDRNNNLTSIFISRKGKMFNLIDSVNEDIIIKADSLLQKISYAKLPFMVTDFAYVAQYQSDPFYCIGCEEPTNDDDLEALYNLYQLIINTLKEIKGEIPLPGLVERIENFISLLDSHRKVEKGINRNRKK